MLNKVVLVTGASGFIGKALVRLLCQNAYTVRALVRSEYAKNSLLELGEKLNVKYLSVYNVGDLYETTKLEEVLKKVDVVVHCAARAHILKETSINPLESFRQINTLATEHLAYMAVKMGVKRFVFLSSIGVLGNSSYEKPFRECSKPHPQTPYAQSKFEAEQILKHFSNEMEVVIVRPSLVYGLGVKGNFEKLINLVNNVRVLPFGKIDNGRQFIGINNLIHFILVCLEHINAANQLFLISDQEVLSTTELIKKIAKYMDRKIIFLPIPYKILSLGLKTIGKKKLCEQLLSNMEIDTNKAKKLLNWNQPFSMEFELRQTIKYYLL